MWAILIGIILVIIIIIVGKLSLKFLSYFGVVMGYLFISSFETYCFIFNLFIELRVSTMAKPKLFKFILFNFKCWNHRWLG